MNIRIGNGIDIHALKPNIPLILGGINIKSSLGIVGHSDGDVLIHSIVDALMGALAIGDIGKYFPSQNSKLENASSAIFLNFALEQIKKNNFLINNIDSTIVLQKPKINEYISDIRMNIAELTSLDVKKNISKSYYY